MMLGKLSKLEIDNVLTSQVIGRIACSDGMRPYIVPVTYTYDGKYIYGQTNEGEKLQILRKNHQVCFEVDIILNMRHWQTVLVHGIFEELTDEAANKAKEILFDRVYSLRTSSTLHYQENGTEQLKEESNRVKRIMYRIKIKKSSGRFERE
jgi:nitroimidazol reductase NimA-like FMN-containing flavoprotein (pyridoxamine 5'-phosphate oxidase superfamily)